MTLHRFLALVILTAEISAVAAQEADSAAVSLPADTLDNPCRFRFQQLIVPAVLVGVGFLGLESDWLKGQNTEARDELQEHPHSHLSLDDFTQYAPLTATYGLKLFGIRSRHNYLDMTIIAGTAYAFTAVSVYSIKTLTKVQRPDGSARNSFPSGHTATAFVGAELLRREYWDTSSWIGVAGYVVAAGTGFMRMYNNRHWLTDVIVGAGIGILSAEAAWWLYPVIKKAFPRRSDPPMIIPAVTPGSVSLSARITF